MLGAVVLEKVAAPVNGPVEELLMAVGDSTFGKVVRG